MIGEDLYKNRCLPRQKGMKRMLNPSAKNYLKAVHFERPDYIPMSFHINDACWNSYPQDRLFDLMEAHPYFLALSVQRGTTLLIIPS